MKRFQIGALTVTFGTPQRGRPTIYDEWRQELKDMHALVRSGLKPNAAAERVAQERYRRMASGSRHIERTQASTVRMLKKHYLVWSRMEAALENADAACRAIRRVLADYYAKNPDAKRLANNKRIKSQRQPIKIPE